MKLPADLRYTASHEWIRAEADGALTVGITDHAQSSLGDLVFLELPKAGRKVGAGEAIAVVESVNSVISRGAECLWISGDVAVSTATEQVIAACRRARKLPHGLHR